MYHSLYIVENSVGILSSLSNLFLIFLASKIRCTGKDIKLIIAVALSEICILICFQIDFIYYLSKGTPLINKQLPCQILGYFGAMFYYFEVMLNLILAIERYCKIIQKKLPKYFFIPLHINTIFSLSVMVWIGYSRLFEPAPGGLICMASVHEQTFSTFVYFYFVGGFTAGIIVISLCYYKLASALENIKMIKSMTIEKRRSCKFSEVQTFSSARTRLFIIIGIYGVLMFLSGLLHILEGALAIYLTKNNDSVILTNQFGQLFGILGLLANPIILLSLHTGITKEFEKFIIRLKSQIL